MKDKVLLKLKNGYISEIADDFDCYESGGCPTCGYDTIYVSEISFNICDEIGMHEDFVVESRDYYEYKFSVSDLIKLFINNIENIKEMTIEDFKTWINKELVGE